MGSVTVFKRIFVFDRHANYVEIRQPRQWTWLGCHQFQDTAFYVLNLRDINIDRKKRRHKERIRRGLKKTINKYKTSNLSYRTHIIRRWNPKIRSRFRLEMTLKNKGY